MKAEKERQTSKWFNFGGGVVNWRSLVRNQQED